MQCGVNYGMLAHPQDRTYGVNRTQRRILYPAKKTPKVKCRFLLLDVDFGFCHDFNYLDVWSHMVTYGHFRGYGFDFTATQ